MVWTWSDLAQLVYKFSRAWKETFRNISYREVSCCITINPRQLLKRFYPLYKCSKRYCIISQKVCGIVLCYRTQKAKGYEKVRRVRELHEILTIHRKINTVLITLQTIVLFKTPLFWVCLIIPHSNNIAPHCDTQSDFLEHVY